MTQLTGHGTMQHASFISPCRFAIDACSSEAQPSGDQLLSRRGCPQGTRLLQTRVPRAEGIEIKTQNLRIVFQNAPLFSYRISKPSFVIDDQRGLLFALIRGFLEEHFRLFNSRLRVLFACLFDFFLRGDQLAHANFTL